MTRRWASAEFASWAVAALATLLGCAHATKVTPPPSSALAAVEVDDSGVPFAPAPEGLLRPGAIDLLQEHLAAGGLLPAGPRSGRLDPPTREALRKFQARHDLPKTGLPSYQTVRALELNPTRIFADARRPPAAATDQPSRDQGSVGGPANAASSRRPAAP